MATGTIEFFSRLNDPGQVWVEKTNEEILANIESLDPDVDSVCFTNLTWPGGGSEHDWKSIFAALPDRVTSITLNHNPPRQMLPGPTRYFIDEFVSMAQEMKESIRELNISSLYFETFNEDEVSEFFDELGAKQPGLKKLGIDFSKEYLYPDRTTSSIEEKHRIQYKSDMKNILSYVPSNIEVLDLSGPDNTLFFSKLTDDELIAIFQPLKDKHILTVQLYERFAADHPDAFRELQFILNKNNAVLVAGTDIPYPKPLSSVLLKTLFESPPEPKEQDSEPPVSPAP